ncbi:hypothetical protein [Amycolatopsis circi]|uniref:hypothetical protein n=1 Tax=Amycolatopsis circi TaxID=871959 RepID=UPI000E2233E4|nr:hypothetical protein [Amycolatopsis circi]
MNTCATGCGRPTDTALCRTCLDDLTKALREVEWLYPELDVTITRQAKTKRGGVGFVTGGSESSTPSNLGASKVADDLRDNLAGWVQNLWNDYSVDRAPLDIVIHPWPLARWLLRHPSWMAGCSYAADLFNEITSRVKRAWNTVLGPRDRLYLGICSADLMVGGDENGEPLEHCDRDLYGLPDRAFVACACGWEWDIQERRAWMLKAMEDQLLTATELSRALPTYLDRPDDKPVTASMIRGYAARGRLLPHSDAASEDPLLDEVPRGRRAPRYRVGDVLDLLAAQLLPEAS